MKKNKNLRLLYKSFDSKLSSEENKKLERELQQNRNYALEKEELLKLRELISTAGDNSLKPFFEERTISKLRELESPNGFGQFLYFQYTMFKRIAFTAIFLVLLLVSYNFIQQGTISFESAFGISSYNLEDVNDPTILLTME